MLFLCVSPVWAEDSQSTADHSKFEQLQEEFETGPEVTKACLSCHTEAAKQLHKTTHWTWAFENQLTGQTL
ncbi:MAG: cytochrome C, partial [Candidatus Thiodiazotropha endolucinida]|nr:cytochrome C [Candidatus Thiodiazotropha endolucinida]